ncbi:MAG: Asp-tRNA(Asn)/Glu-tRNA(Gln) amidotransferase subunit GatB [Alphaproteobacteria bacterium]|nr:Asp-tRNA(Asn)/Glu-tRNA(Gln) amidotransferase subunit GatB [Alphaproteobacteria bacterium]
MSGTIQGATGTWEMVIGLEVHAQITSKSKLFSGASTAFGAEPNTQVSLVDAAMPGMLPVINKVCVEQAVRTGLGLKAQINLRSVFDRKNYFYPDLPQGYQISQFLQPVVGAGTVVLDMDDGQTREIGITRLHLEQDAGKSVHDLSPDRTYVDLNRSGIGLMEIVSEPDLRTPEEAGAYLRKLRSILRYLGTCDGNMEQGSMRADVNVSVRRPGADYGTRCEIKNVNSVRFVQQAIEYEAQRQVDILEEGGVIAQQTRLFDARKGETRSMRSKEEAHDYRYFPDPDLLPLEFDQAWVEEIASSLPELPDDRKARFVGELGLSPYDAGVLVAEKEVAEFFEEAARGRDAKTVVNWIMGDLFGALNKSGLDIARSPISAAHLGALIDLIGDNTISGRIAKDVFDEMMKTGRAPAEIVDQRGLRQVTDSGAIEAIVDAVMEGNPDKVTEYRAGKDKLFGFFVGQVMKQSQGKANPKIVNDLLQRKLSG